MIKARRKKAEGLLERGKCDIDRELKGKAELAEQDAQIRRQKGGRCRAVRR